MRHMYRLLYRQLVVIAVCLGACAAARADTVVLQTNFQLPQDLGTYPVGSSVGTPDSFRVAPGASVEVVGASTDPANPCVAAGGTGQCLRLPPPPGTVPFIISNKQFGAGEYFVTLSIAGGDSTRTIIAEFPGLGQGFFTVGANDPFRTFEFSATVPTSVLAELQINGYGVLINSITVTQIESQTPAPVPEPATMLLFATGLVGVAARVRRRRRPGL